MKTIEVIHEKDNIEIFYGNKIYTSQVSEIFKEDNLLKIAMPLCKRQKLFIFQNKTFDARIISSAHGLLKFKFLLEKYEGNIPIIKVEGKIAKQQRRNFFRIKVMKKIDIYFIRDGEKDFLRIELLEKIEPNFNYPMKDVSLGGIGIYSDEKINIGKKIMLCFNIENEKFWNKAEVVNCRESNDKYIVGVQFFDLNKKNKNRLNDFIIKKQREILKIEHSMKE
jgi:c-di-GMP-binding flagellar brake protein YcgR